MFVAPVAATSSFVEGALSNSLSTVSTAAPPVLIEVEYVPSRPTLNRLQGDGSQSFFSWLWRTALSAGPGETMTTVAARGASSLMVLQTIRLSGWSEW